jgi:MoxR-like ATPase
MINEENQEINPEHEAFMPKENIESNNSPEINDSTVENSEETKSGYGFERSNEDLIWVAQKVNQVRQEMSKFVIGQGEMVELLMTGIFSNGHVLLEGVPGVAKTLSSKVLSKALDIQFSRIQFTPDLMPSDVLGTSVFNMKDSSFNFRRGPIFSNIVLIDEINRAPAKTQAALFEVMEERQITYDGNRYEMEFPFLVIATMNPIEQEGTYNLPEAQLDRFLFKIKINYPDLEQETEILKRYKNNIKTPDLDEVDAVFTVQDISRIQGLIEKIIIEDNLLQYIANLTFKTRNHGKIYLGGSPRASLSMLKASKAVSAIRGRDFVTPEDIQFVAPHVLNHRLILTPEAEMEGVQPEEVIAEIIQMIEVPR